MKCVFCNHEIEDDAQFCPNCGKKLPQPKCCPHCGEQLDDDAQFCPNCGKKTSQSSTDKRPSNPTSKPNTAVPRKKESQELQWWVKAILLIGLLALVGYGVFAIFSSGGKASEEDDSDFEERKRELVDSDSIQKARMVEQQMMKDSLSKTADLLADSLAQIKDSLKKEAEKTVVAKDETEKAKVKNNGKNGKGKASDAGLSSPATVSGTRNLGYATFRGPLRNGRPHGVNGRMIYKTTHLIDNRDPKGRVAEPGDYVIGEYYEGHLVQGIWYDAYNQVKGSIIIGR